ncbi:MAG TPA: hypothetical protein VJP76_00275 [Candidatus Tumulicola sp.]|nr:hypothetical protein [Candidatus Tumulicola sp.]
MSPLLVVLACLRCVNEAAEKARTDAHDLGDDNDVWEISWSRTAW